MGLGKTLQTISLLGFCLEYLKIRGPHIILVPKSTLANWEKEVNKWCPSLRSLIFQGDKESRQEIIRTSLQPGLDIKDRSWDVCITTYETAVIERGPLGKIAWQYLIIDEAHRIKNENSALAQVVRSFVALHRLLITGTPLQVSQRVSVRRGSCCSSAVVILFPSFFLFSHVFHRTTCTSFGRC